ncbi:hypothetical protein [Nioella aestuarii]|uniref:hypothetical protein n=1 Tax=Nioella aestuarii TaxID=1662864 RepID=UPI003D7FFA2C
MDRRYFWTKVWGSPGIPAHDALAFNHESTRDAVLADAQPGDIVVYLTSDATEADPLMRGRVAGAVEVADPPEPVMVEELRGHRSRPEDYRKDGRFRWPFGITVSRTWKVIDQEANDALVPDHASKGIQGAATIHPMRPEEVQRFLRLRVEEQVEGEKTDRQPFSASVSRPWRQKVGKRAGSEVQPGSQLYIAVIADSHGMTFKIGSGKAEDRLSELNHYRRPSQGEMLWAKYQVWDFATVDAARAAEDHLLARAREMGHGSKDHTEFVVGIAMPQLAELFTEAVAVGQAQDERES